MSRFLRIVALVVVVAVAGAVAYGSMKNPETTTLNDESRTAAVRAGESGKFVASPVGTTHYDITGLDTGRVVVLVHGFSVPAYIWDSTYNTLSAAGFRVIRYDLMGRGLSDRPDVAYDGALFDAQLNTLLDSLHVTAPVDLMGLSFGGFVTAHYVASHAQRVRTWTLLDPVASTRVMPALLSMPVIGEWIWQTTQVPGMADNQSSDFLHPEQFPGWADRYRPQMQYRGFGRALLRSAITMSRTNFDSLYSAAGQTHVPTLLVWGKQDRTVSILLSDVVRRGVPQAEFMPVDSAGHLPALEQSAVVHSRMLAFLRTH